MTKKRSRTEVEDNIKFEDVKVKIEQDNTTPKTKKKKTDLKTNKNIIVKEEKETEIKKEEVKKEETSSSSSTSYPKISDEGVEELKKVFEMYLYLVDTKHAFMNIIKSREFYFPALQTGKLIEYYDIFKNIFMLKVEYDMEHYKKQIFKKQVMFINNYIHTYLLPQYVNGIKSYIKKIKQKKHVNDILQSYSLKGYDDNAVKEIYTFLMNVQKIKT